MFPSLRPLLPSVLAPGFHFTLAYSALEGSAPLNLPDLITSILAFSFSRFLISSLHPFVRSLYFEACGRVEAMRSSISVFSKQKDLQYGICLNFRTIRIFCVNAEADHRDQPIADLTSQEGIVASDTYSDIRTRPLSEEPWLTLLVFEH